MLYSRDFAVTAVCVGELSLFDQQESWNQPVRTEDTTNQNKVPDMYNINVDLIMCKCGNMISKVLEPQNENYDLSQYYVSV